MSNPDEILVEAVGTSGLCQICVLLLLYLNRIWVAWNQLIMLIVSPEIGNFTCSDPKLNSCDDECPKHIFDHSVWDNTLIHEWDLVCSRSWVPTMIQSVITYGFLVGNVLFGFGRRISLFCSVALQLIAGIATGFVQNLYLYILLRFITTIGTGGSIIPSFALLMEFTDKKYRSVVGVIFMIPMNIGQATLGLIGYLSRSWRSIHFIIAISSSILLLDYFLPESPRWLLTQKKVEKCIHILEKGAVLNKRSTEHIRNNVESYIDELPENVRIGGNIWDLFRTNRMRLKTIILCVTWTVTSMEFCALNLYMGKITGNIFISIAISGLIQMPTVLLSVWLVDVIGRKFTIITGFTVISIPMFLMIALPREPYWPVATFACLSVSGTAINFALIFIYSSELFPTVVRSLGMGVNSMSGGIGSMITPFIMQIHNIHIDLPPIMFTIFPILTILLILLLPETRNKPLPDTVEDADLL